jgi:UDP-N-acetylmuramate-alanine ligase
VVREGATRVADQRGVEYNLKVFGTHNLQNLSAAMLACKEVGLSEDVFLSSMQNFSGASMRLQLIFESGMLAVYRDFAHAPSKVAATVQAVRERFPRRQVIACFELHTYSSLNADFLPQYAGTLDHADHAMIFYSPNTLQIKKMAAISPTDILKAFSHDSLEVITGAQNLEERLRFFAHAKEETVIVLMSSGRFGQIDLSAVFTVSNPDAIS